MKDLISVIITVYNNEKTLKDCILSVISQTYRNIEIIIVDDGSSDNSSAIYNELLIANSKLKIVSLFHSGINVARNRGIEEASGKYITFVNGSDKLEKNCLENLYLMISSYDAEISVCSVYLDRKKSTSNKIITLDKVDALRQLLIEDKILNTPCGKLFSRSLFDYIRFSNYDVETVYKLFEQCRKITFMNNDCYFLRSKEIYSLSSCLNKDLRIMKLYPELSIYCKCNIVKEIQNEFYNCIINNKTIDDEKIIYDNFKKIVLEDGDDIVKFFGYVRRAHLYLLADDLKNYKILCPVLPELK